MITPGFVRMMAAYNSEMNCRLYDAAARLDDADRRAGRGAFWGSIHGTLSHLMWGDTMWMSRFDGWTKPGVGIKESARFIDDFEALRAARVRADADITRWAAGVEQAWLDGDLHWYSGAAQRDLSESCSKLVTHFFNHQTHHRGQAHAMITAAGEATGDTDLFLIVPA
jgi:uncharacterized damage-inducible protein DinB